MVSHPAAIFAIAALAASWTDPPAQTPVAATKQTMVSSSTPADGSMLVGPPARFEVTFVHPMKLKSVAIVDVDGRSYPVVAQSEALGPASARIDLPKLAPGTYKLNWRAQEGNGQEVRGDLSFMVH